MGIKELNRKGEGLIETGRNLEQRIVDLQNEININTQRLSYAYEALAYAQQVDEDGNSKGDVSAARMQLEILREQIRRAEFEQVKCKEEIQEVNNKKKEVIFDINRITKAEESNVEKLRALQSKMMSKNAAAMISAIIARMNEGAETVEQLQVSMGMNGNVKRYSEMIPVRPIEGSYDVTEGDEVSDRPEEKEAYQTVPDRYGDVSEEVDPYTALPNTERSSGQVPLSSADEKSEDYNGGEEANLIQDTETVDASERQEKLTKSENTDEVYSSHDGEIVTSKDYRLPPLDFKVLVRDEFDLLESGNDAINRRLEAKADDYKDKGLSDEEIADRLAADKWEFQKEFLEDAFPGQDVSPSVFNAFNEHGAKDRLDAIERSPHLREILAGEKTSENLEAEKNVVQDVKSNEYNQTLKEFCEGNGYVKNVDFSDFDPHVAYVFAKAVVDAKKDFPDLEVNYLGSIDHQVKGIHDTVEASQFDFYKKNGFDEGLAQQMARQYADDYIHKNKLNYTAGTYAWSIKTGNRSLDKFDGVAVNNEYAKDYTRFKSKKQVDVAAKWAPIGCGCPKAVADHELGHEIDNLLGASKDRIINDLYSDMMKKNNAEEVLSGYSKKNVQEFIAESYSEYRNNSRPRDVSKKVFNRLIELQN